MRWWHLMMRLGTWGAMSDADTIMISWHRSYVSCILPWQYVILSYFHYTYLGSKASVPFICVIKDERAKCCWLAASLWMGHGGEMLTFGTNPDNHHQDVAAQRSKELTNWDTLTQDGDFFISISSKHSHMSCAWLITVQASELWYQLTNCLWIWSVTYIPHKA